MKTYLTKRVQAFGHAFRGLESAFRSEQHVRIHTTATGIVIALSLYLGLAVWEWVALLCVMGLVWVAELVNTAIEGFVDLVSPEQHPLAGRAKDIAAAAVLVAALVAASVGLLVFVPYVLS